MKLSIAVVSLPLLLLIACGGDGGEPASSNAGATAPAASDAAGTSAVRHAESIPSGAAQPTSYEGFDIAGLYLGMSPEEVTAALRAYDPDIAIRQDTVDFTYNALGTRHRTESFVHYVSGAVPGGSVSLDEFDNQAWIQSLIDEKSAPGTERPRL